MLSNLKTLLSSLIRSFVGSARSKHDARYTFLQAVAAKVGMRLYNRNLVWLADAEFRAMWARFPEGDDYVHERRFNLYNFAKTVTHLDGDIAECGVFRGAGSFIMLSATEKTNKHLHGFDSFEGLSQPGTSDEVHTPTSFQWEANQLAVAESIATSNLSSFTDRVTLHRGWIPERFAEVVENIFCLVHIDVDLFEPTRDAVEFFYPRLVEGGLLICDDYGLASCPGAKKAMDEQASRFGTSVIHLTTGQGVLIKSTRSNTS